MSFVSTPGAADNLDLEKMAGGSTTRNEWKNESLYIAFKDEQFKTPSEMITLKKAERTIALAIFSFESAQQFVSLGGKLATRKTEDAKRIFRNFDPYKIDHSKAAEIIKSINRLIHSRSKSQGTSKDSE